MLSAVIFWGLLLPAGAAGLILLLGWRPWKRALEPDAAAAAAGPLALGGAWLAAQIAIVGVALPPVQASDWLAVLVAAAVLGGLVEALRRPPAWMRWSWRAALSLALPALLALPLWRSSWSSLEALAVIGAAAIGVFGAWSLLEAQARRRAGAAMPLLLAVLAGGSALVLALSGSASLGQLGGALAAAVGAALVIALLQPRLSLAHGAIGPLVIALAGLWLNGTFYADVPIGSLVLLFVAPWLALVGRLGRVQRLAAWQSALVRAGAVLLPLALAAAWAYGASPPLTEQPYW